jgi:hypothetical protein
MIVRTLVEGAGDDFAALWPAILARPTPNRTAR